MFSLFFGIWRHIGVICSFGAYRLDTDRLELWCGEEAVSVEPQVFGVLCCLVENRDRVVSKEELIERVWDGRFIADICPQVIEFGPLNATIHKLNECVGVADIEPLKRTYQLTLENLLVTK